MLGNSLCQFYNNDYEVYAFHRDKKCFATCSEEYSLDLTDSIQLQSNLNQIKPDLVIHCAGLINLDQCEQNPEIAYKGNVEVSDNVAKACNKETKLVYVSTDQVYGKTEDHSEGSVDLQPVNQYGKTKYLGERKAAEHCPDCIIIRTNIFGWNVKPGKISSAEWIYNSLENGRVITLFDDYFFSPIYTKCLGEIIIQLVEMNFSGIINIGSPIPCSKYEFGKQLAKEFKFDQSYINRGSIYDHSFKASRASDLNIKTKKAINLKIKIPDYKASINKFRINQHLIVNQKDLAD